MKLDCDVCWFLLKDPADLKTVVAMLYAHGIQTEEGLHRPWRSASFESSVMVSPEDYPEASVLYKELEIPAGIKPCARSKLDIIEADGTWKRTSIARFLRQA
jgi:hypothetical protein